MKQKDREMMEKIAEIKGMEYEDVARITCENAKVFYGIE